MEEKREEDDRSRALALRFAVNAKSFVKWKIRTEFINRSCRRLLSSHQMIPVI